MAEKFTHKRNVVYECVDKDAESVPGSAGGINGATFYHVQVQCNGLLCPPYDKEKELACVVCTKWKNYNLNSLILISIINDFVICTLWYNFWKRKLYFIKALRYTCETYVIEHDSHG